jgi:hypothetical protein
MKRKTRTSFLVAFIGLILPSFAGQICVDGYKWSQPFSVNSEGIMQINLKSELDESPLYLRTEIQTGTKESHCLVIFRHASVSSPYRLFKTINLCSVLK